MHDTQERLGVKNMFYSTIKTIKDISNTENHEKKKKIKKKKRFGKEFIDYLTEYEFLKILLYQ